ncbi:WecB/TagA/CpsF family glycosyltransferase [Curtobacterium sp. MCBD17_023]|uniref:WecB/TagA/CpsF family glycosyltransferase n=1 Tax=Curtobacterium sp. MCBD17_023 TaxID=2175657 RepID=UPI0015E8C8DF|nr:WecB/TagA/CpsF family glycosyltransferase [Curtobacterium sp. MCBD17_023]
MQIANYNLHGVYMHMTNEAFAAYTGGADLRLIDGWPILAASLWPRLGSSKYRVGSTDWLEVLLRHEERSRLRIVAIGGTSAASRLAEAAVTSAYEGLIWEGIDGYDGIGLANTDETDRAIEGANLVLVAMGMPKQEEWIVAHEDQLRGKVVANVGGVIDYLAGAQSLAPRWMGRLGVEWLYRLLLDPRRLADRYLLEPFRLFAILRRRGSSDD